MFLVHPYLLQCRFWQFGQATDEVPPVVPGESSTRTHEIRGVLCVYPSHSDHFGFVEHPAPIFVQNVVKLLSLLLIQQGHLRKFPVLMRLWGGHRRGEAPYTKRIGTRLLVPTLSFNALHPPVRSFVFHVRSFRFNYSQCTPKRIIIPFHYVACESRFN